MTPLQKAIREKQAILREEYGGMMSLPQLQKELGLKSRQSVRGALRSLDLPETLIGGRYKFDTDLVARRLVERRGAV